MGIYDKQIAFWRTFAFKTVLGIYVFWVLAWGVAFGDFFQSLSYNTKTFILFVPAPFLLVLWFYLQRDNYKMVKKLEKLERDPAGILEDEDS